MPERLHRPVYLYRRARGLGGTSPPFIETHRCIVCLKNLENVVAINTVYALFAAGLYGVNCYYLGYLNGRPR